MDAAPSPEIPAASLEDFRLSADPDTFIRMCETALAVLAGIVASGDIDRIAAARTSADAFWTHAHQKRFPQAAQQPAAELLRRAERGIGLAIQRGQANGTVRRDGDRNSLPSPSDYVRGARLRDRRRGKDRGYSPGIYALVTDVTDEAFEDAIAAARAEGNLSRANVVRKLPAPGPPAPGGRQPAARPGPGGTGPRPARRCDKIRAWAAEGLSSRQMGQRLHLREDSVREIARKAGIPVPADEAVRGTRRLSSERIIREAARSLDGIAQVVVLASPADLDPATAQILSASMSRSLQDLSQFTRTMKEISSDRS